MRIVDYFGDLAELCEVLVELLDERVLLEAADEHAASSALLALLLQRLHLLVPLALHVLLELFAFERVYSVELANQFTRTLLLDVLYLPFLKSKLHRVQR